jgi:hypothetical protein
MFLAVNNEIVIEGVQLLWSYALPQTSNRFLTVTEEDCNITTGEYCMV